MKCFYHSDMDGKCAGSIVARVTGNYNSKDYIMYNYDGEIPTELRFNLVRSPFIKYGYSC